MKLAFSMILLILSVGLCTAAPQSSGINRDLATAIRDQKCDLDSIAVFVSYLNIETDIDARRSTHAALQAMREDLEAEVAALRKPISSPAGSTQEMQDLRERERLVTAILKLRLEAALLTWRVEQLRTRALNKSDTEQSSPGDVANRAAPKK